jgi:acetyl esterase/lipase
MKRVAKKHRGSKKSKFVYSKLYLGIIIGIISSVIIVGGYCSWNKNRQIQQDHQKPLEVSNLTYCNGEKLDIKVPISEKPVPLVIYVHGGGWQWGSKVGGSAPYFYKLVDKGIAVASINYHLSGRAKFPSAVKDVQCAIKYLKFHSSQFNIDSRNIILAGQSAGGNLALVSSMASHTGIFAGESFREISPDVSGVITIGAIYDLESKALSKNTKINIDLYLKDSIQASVASPSSYITQTNLPPMLIFHGDNDKSIPYSEAENFAKNMQRVGGDVDMVLIKNADHNLWSWFGFDRPSSNSRLKLIEEFIQKVTVD